LADLAVVDIPVMSGVVLAQMEDIGDAQAGEQEAGKQQDC